MTKSQPSFLSPPHIPELHLLELPGDEKSVELLEMLLRYTPQPFWREQFAPGHVTATALALHPDGKQMAMVFHARLERWLLPGGHVEEEDADIFAAAARELLEESGIRAENGSGPKNGSKVLGVDVHGIPPKIRDGQILEPFHQHHDILIGFHAASTVLVLSDESHAVRWVAPEEFDVYAVPPNIRRAYRRFV